MYDVAIIGCGISGASCAYMLSGYDLRIAVFEKSNDVANGTTKANSAIIHAGYDPKPGTNMAKLNVRGTELAKEIAADLDVPINNCGSMVLAFDENDIAHVNELYEQGVANGVPGVRVITGDEAREIEPELSSEVTGALYAPSSCIINPWEYCLAMAETAVVNGVELFLETAVTGISAGPDEGFVIETNKGDFRAKYVLSAAGVYADEVRRYLEEPDYEIVPTRGQYFLLDKEEGRRVGTTIFQCPDEKGKGVLVSPTVDGNLIVGPDAVVSSCDDKTTDKAGLDLIAKAAAKSVPGINFRMNIRNFAGVRANSDSSDFIIEESSRYPGFIDIAGIKSPGLSAAPAIAEQVVDMLAESGLKLEKKKTFISKRKRPRLPDVDEARTAAISKDPAYGRIICRCETVSEGEITAALHTPIPPRSINGVKRRVGAGMGRCQGGFCMPKVQEIIARETGADWLEICLEEPGSEILKYKTKEAE